jgi:hypothetical protein
MIRDEGQTSGGVTNTSATPGTVRARTGRNLHGRASVQPLAE